MRVWWIAGTWLVAAAWVLCAVVQVVSGDPLPPDISVSQYGVGPDGWLFSVWIFGVSAGPCLLYLYRPVRGFGARWWLLLGLVGAAVMATVRTDPGGLQQSVNAKIHTAGAVLTLIGLPIGMMVTLLAAAAVWRRLSIGLVAISAVALELLLISAGGFDTTGFGAATSWAFWQAISMVADMLLPIALVFGVLTIPPFAGAPEPWWSRYGPGGPVGRRTVRTVDSGIPAPAGGVGSLDPARTAR